MRPRSQSGSARTPEVEMQRYLGRIWKQLRASIADSQRTIWRETWVPSQKHPASLGPRDSPPPPGGGPGGRGEPGAGGAFLGGGVVGAGSAGSPPAAAEALFQPDDRRTEVHLRQV